MKILLEARIKNKDSPRSATQLQCCYFAVNRTYHDVVMHRLSVKQMIFCRILGNLSDGTEDPFAADDPAVVCGGDFGRAALGGACGHCHGTLFPTKITKSECEKIPGFINCWFIVLELLNSTCCCTGNL